MNELISYSDSRNIVVEIALYSLKPRKKGQIFTIIEGSPAWTFEKLNKYKKIFKEGVNEDTVNRAVSAAKNSVIMCLQAAEIQYKINREIQYPTRVKKAYSFTNATLRVIK